MALYSIALHGAASPTTQKFVKQKAFTALTLLGILPFFITCLDRVLSSTAQTHHPVRGSDEEEAYLYWPVAA